MTEVPQTPKNIEILEGLKNFFKYNAYLVHFDLQSTGMSAQIIRVIGQCLTRATGLQAIHLCGNEGITDEMIEWLRVRIHAKDHSDPINVKPLPKS